MAAVHPCLSCVSNFCPSPDQQASVSKPLFRKGNFTLHKESLRFTLPSVMWRNTALSGFKCCQQEDLSMKTSLWPDCHLSTEAASQAARCDTELLPPDFQHRLYRRVPRVVLALSSPDAAAEAMLAACSASQFKVLVSPVISLRTFPLLATIFGFCRQHL